MIDGGPQASNLLSHIIIGNVASYLTMLLLPRAYFYYLELFIHTLTSRIVSLLRLAYE